MGCYHHPLWALLPVSLLGPFMDGDLESTLDDLDYFLLPEWMM
jgi:hypothetical protein